MDTGWAAPACRLSGRAGGQSGSRRDPIKIALTINQPENCGKNNKIALAGGTIGGRSDRFSNR
jgi:hypothetical protein